MLEAKANNHGQVRLYLDGQLLSKQDISQLKEEVRLLLSFRLWRIMQETTKQKAVEISLNRSTKWEDVLAGKMMLHDLGILHSIVEAIDNARSEHHV